MRRTWWGLAAFLLAFAGLIAAGGERAQAQLGPPKFLKATATAMPKTVVPGKPFTVVVAITVDKPYHIQANPPKKDYVATVVDFSAARGFKVGKIRYPPARQAKISGDTLPVYEGTVKVTAVLTADK